MKNIWLTLNVLCGERALGDIRAACSWSYQRLTSAEARMFRVPGAHRIRDITADDAGQPATGQHQAGI
ncbi:hypothetical protein [Streptomyces sp. NPDC059008]|uniref:hypothetical protein n=1 Tax=Streptomyces sp. NPDC059008 TaxID=3346693 RepID=UPI0036CFE56D